MKTVIKKVTPFTLSIMLSVFNIMAQERQFVIQGDDLNLQLGEVHVDELFHMDKEFTQLNQLGNPLNVHFEDRFSELYWVYTYEKYKLTYVDIGDGPVLFQIEIDTPSAEMKLGEMEVTSLQTIKSSTFGRSNDQVLKVNKTTNENVKFGDKVEYIEVIIKDEKVVKLIYRHDLQI